MKLMCPSPVIVTPLCKAPWEQISFQEPRIVGLWRQFYTILWNMHSNKVAKRDWKGFQCLTVRLETFLWLFKTFRNFLGLSVQKVPPKKSQEVQKQFSNLLDHSWNSYGQKYVNAYIQNTVPTDLQLFLHEYWISN